MYLFINHVCFILYLTHDMIYCSVHSIHQLYFIVYYMCQFTYILSMSLFLSILIFSGLILFFPQISFRKTFNASSIIASILFNSTSIYQESSLCISSCNSRIDPYINSTFFAILISLFLLVFHLFY